MASPACPHPARQVETQETAHLFATNRTGRTLAAMTPPLPPSPQDRIHSESFLRDLMRRQLRLSVACAAAFLVALLGLPLLNYFAPAAMAVRVGGFTLTWLILGVLFFPYVWLISGFFIKRSLQLEANEAREALRK